MVVVGVGMVCAPSAHFLDPFPIEGIGVKMAKLACLGPFWVLTLGLTPGMSGISEHLGAY